MTPWLNRGAKKTNEPTIPLILQGSCAAAALVRSAARASIRASSFPGKKSLVERAV